MKPYGKLKRTRTTKHPWLIACSARDGTRRSVNVRSRSAKGEWVEKVYDYVKACGSLEGRIEDMHVKEDFESRPHKAVTFVVQRGKEREEWNEQQLPKALPGYSGGRLPRRSMEEKGREEEVEALRGWPSKDKTPHKGGIARRLRMKKKKVGKEATEWQDNGKRSNIRMT